MKPTRHGAPSAQLPTLTRRTHLASISCSPVTRCVWLCAADCQWHHQAHRLARSLRRRARAGWWAPIAELGGRRPCARRHRRGDRPTYRRRHTMPSSVKHAGRRTGQSSCSALVAGRATLFPKLTGWATMKKCRGYLPPICDKKRVPKHAMECYALFTKLRYPCPPA